MELGRIFNGIINAFIGEGKPVALTQDQLAQTSAHLTNPAMRVALPASFPTLLGSDKTYAILEMLRRELKEKHGTTLEEAGRINIVYPRKHPLKFPRHDNTADFAAKKTWHALKRAKPDVEWVFANSLNELERLGRSENQTSIHALTAKQEYVVYDPMQEAPAFRFGQAGNTKKEFFLMVDSGFEQGTTMANLFSFIEANGGAVLGAAVNQPNHKLQQRDTSVFNDRKNRASLRPEFNDASRNTGRLAQMALAFSDSAKRGGMDLTPQQALDLFEEKLNKVGNTIFAMTDGEASRIIRTVKGTYDKPMSFSNVIRALDAKAAELNPQKPQSAPKLQLQGAMA